MGDTLPPDNEELLDSLLHGLGPGTPLTSLTFAELEQRGIQVLPSPKRDPGIPLPPKSWHFQSLESLHNPWDHLVNGGSNPFAVLAIVVDAGRIKAWQVPLERRLNIEIVLERAHIRATGGENSLIDPRCAYYVYSGFYVSHHQRAVFTENALLRRELIYAIAGLKHLERRHKDPKWANEPVQCGKFRIISVIKTGVRIIEAFFVNGKMSVQLVASLDMKDTVVGEKEAITYPEFVDLWYEIVDRSTALIPDPPTNLSLPSRMVKQSFVIET